MTNLTRSLLAAALVVLCAWPLEVAAQTARADGPVEDIYVVRSLRLTRIAPTEYCDARRTGFGGATAEDRYSFHSVAVRSSDGLVTDAKAATVGSLHACFGATADPLTRTFYAEGELGGVAFRGYGECRTTKEDFPEPGVSISRCLLDLRNLPAEYRGGQLTTNSAMSRNTLGDASDPPGYVQSSIATVRLWKTRRQ